MTALSGQLRHSRFFEQLAASDESDLQWRVASAGLVVLRCVDDWLAGDATEAALAPRAEHARAEVERLPAGHSTRALLLNMLDAVADANERDIRLVTPLLMAYARALDFDANWNLAIDVYETVVDHIPCDAAPDTVVTALVRRGHCQIALGAHAEASELFRCAKEVADRATDLAGVLRAELGEAKVVIARGNLPKADAMLEATAARAMIGELTQVWSRATHERARIAHLRGDYQGAIRLDYAALRSASEASERDRIVADLAAAFFELGVRSAARDAYLILASTSCEQEQRWLVTINLMVLAADAGSRPQFERYLRQMDPVPLSARLRVELELHAGRGYQQLGDFDAAGEWLRRALDSAEAHSLNALVFDAESSLRDNALRRLRPGAAVEVSLPKDIETIAAGLREMREHAAESAN